MPASQTCYPSIAQYQTHAMRLYITLYRFHLDKTVIDQIATLTETKQNQL